ncbi:hypothetical protein [Streptomyces deccanensis]|nr:hypothetical protein [Streptomyces deccanensis]ULR48538.1 hypothetical protein L3078_04200 [Streptomyces deccanensis]
MGLIAMLAGFLLGWAGTSRGRHREAAAEETDTAGWKEQVIAGAGAE